jgi:hypothetical protein
MENQLCINQIISYFLENNVDIDELNLNEKSDYKYLESYNSYNFKKFNNFFKGSIDRIGIPKNNLSLYFTILYLLFDEFKSYDNLKQSKLMNELKLIASDKVNDEMNQIFSLSEYFNINIFLFSYTTDITLFYKDDEYIPYKNNIFINEFENYYYPFVYKNNAGNIFKYNSAILKDILLYENLKIFSINSDKSLIILDNDYNKIAYKSFNINLGYVKNLLDDEISDNSQNTTHSISLESNDEINLLNLSDEIKLVDNKMSSHNDNIDIINKIKNSDFKKLEREKKTTLLSYIEKLFKKNEDLNLKSKKSVLVNYLKDNTI